MASFFSVLLELSAQVRRSRIEDEEFDFFHFDWLGQRWLTGQIPDGLVAPILPKGPPPLRVDWRLTWAISGWGLPIFAVESKRAFQILATISRFPGHEDVDFDIRPMSLDLMRAARIESGGGAAIYGFAAFTDRNLIKGVHRIVYNSHKDAIIYGSW